MTHASFRALHRRWHVLANGQSINSSCTGHLMTVPLIMRRASSLTPERGNPSAAGTTALAESGSTAAAASAAPSTTTGISTAAAATATKTTTVDTNSRIAISKERRKIQRGTDRSIFDAQTGDASAFRSPFIDSIHLPPMSVAPFSFWTINRIFGRTKNQTKNKKTGFLTVLYGNLCRRWVTRLVHRRRRQTMMHFMS